jgi:2-dehydropantoate 2-reductase
MFQKIVVVGAGAVGGFFGALLHRAGVDVTFLVRPHTRTQIANHGLEIRSTDAHYGQFTVHPPCIERISPETAADLILLAVKCYDLPAALEAVAPLVDRGATLLTLQNGVDHEARAYFKKDCVVEGVTYITSRLAGPGVVEHFRRGHITLGETSGEESERVRKIHQLFTEAHIPCRITHHIREAKWEKLCWNATFNPLSVILDSSIGLILDIPQLSDIVRQAISEVVAIAVAEGVSLRPQVAQETLSVSNAFRDFHTSMYEDYKNGKPTEIESLVGHAVRLGARHAIATPTLQTLYGLVVGLEQKRAGHSVVEVVAPSVQIAHE